MEFFKRGVSVNILWGNVEFFTGGVSGNFIRGTESFWK